MLKKWRKSAGLTQLHAAERLGMSVRTYCRWELEGIPSGLETIMALALKGEISALGS